MIDLDFLKLLKHFQKLSEKCFSFKLDLEYHVDLKKFTETWQNLGLPNSSKFHIVKYHLKEFFEITKRGLGIFNEQASESVHSDFKVTWERYKTANTSIYYKTQLLKATIDYNSGHL